MKILKYELDPNKVRQTLKMPAGAQILSAHCRNKRPCIWAVVDPERPETDRHFGCFETGRFFHNDYKAFIGTTNLGAFSIHVFELINPTPAKNGNEDN